GNEVREGAHDAHDEDMLAAGRQVHLVEDGRLPDGTARSGRDVDEGELRGEVVVEEPFVERVLQKIFVGRRGCGAAAGLLRRRADRRWRRDGSWASVGRNEPTQETRARRRPLARWAIRRVEIRASESAGLPGGGVGDPA